MSAFLGAAIGVVALAGTTKSPAQSTAKSVVTIAANIAADCTMVSPQTVDFGTYDPSSNSQVDVTANALQISCTKGSPGVTIGLDNGQYYTGSHRSMRSLGGSGAVYYEIYTTSSRQIIWNRTQTVTYTSLGRQPSTVQLFGRVVGSQSPSPGDYSDTLTALLNF